MTFDQFCSEHMLRFTAVRVGIRWQCWLNDVYNRLVYRVRWNGSTGYQESLFGFGNTIPEAIADIVGKMRGHDLQNDVCSTKSFCTVPTDLISSAA